MLSSYDLRTNHRCKHPHKLTVSLIVKERRQIVFSETVKYEPDRSDLSTPWWLLTAWLAVVAAEARCAFYVVVNLCQPLFCASFRGRRCRLRQSEARILRGQLSMSTAYFRPRFAPTVAGVPRSESAHYRGAISGVKHPRAIFLKYFYPTLAGRGIRPW